MSIVVGIDDYQHVSPLGFAVADAEAVADLLRTRFAFPTENVTLLLNDAATKTSILDRFFSYASSSCAADDRIVVFFAGHGHTLQTRRGEVGFLVPFDGDPANLASLIRWQELALGADTFYAKHVVFFMDACFSGLMITRALRPGSMRFLEDMLVRPARQVLTAGKANELVGDEGGPLPGHSPFTGHLLEALGGRAAYSDGIITANGVMAYVYQAVGRDGRSRQTPHYGYLDGDGDLVFDAPILTAAVLVSTKDEDVLVTVPAVAGGGASPVNEDVVSRTKECLSEDRHRIQLHDTIAGEIRRAMLLTSDDSFAVQGVAWSDDQFRERISRYDAIMHDLCSIEALIAYWATEATRQLVCLAPRRLTDRLETAAGLTAWLALRWYPVLLLVYSGGIAAVAGKQYDNLRELLDSRVSARREEEESLVQAVFAGQSDVTDAFKLLPGHARHYTPRSEYLHKLLQPMLDDLLFLGSDYDNAFDRFEILVSLEYMHQSDRDWGPIGRFGWKVRRGVNPLQQLLSEAETQGAGWAPLRAGLFSGSQERFNEVSQRLRALAARLSWY